MIRSKCQCYSSITHLTIAVIAMLTLNLFSGSVVYAQAGDEFEGAVWQFGMNPKVRGDEALRGAFRVADDNIFQRNGRDDEKFERPAGTNFPKGRTTRIVFKNMVAFKKEGGSASERRGERRVELSGTATLKMDEFGEWSGRFVDGAGHRWDFKCSRIKE